jgi:thioredoxin 1
MLKINESNFDLEVIESAIPVLVVFYAEWCELCDQYKIELLKFKEQFQNEIKICMINSDESLELKKYYGIQGLPTTLLFVDGNETKELKGIWDHETIIAFAKHAL